MTISMEEHVDTPIRRSVRLAALSNGKVQKSFSMSPRNILRDAAFQPESGTDNIENEYHPNGANRSNRRSPKSTRKTPRVVNDNTNPFWEEGSESNLYYTQNIHTSPLHSTSNEELMLNESPPDLLIDQRFLVQTEASPDLMDLHNISHTRGHTSNHADPDATPTASSSRNAAPKSARKSALKRRSNLSRVSNLNSSGESSTENEPNPEPPKPAIYTIFFGFVYSLFSHIYQSVKFPSLYSWIGGALYKSGNWFKKSLSKISSSWTLPRPSVVISSASERFLPPLKRFLRNALTFMLKRSVSAGGFLLNKGTDMFVSFLDKRHTRNSSSNRIKVFFFIFLVSSSIYMLKSYGILEGVANAIEENRSIIFEAGSPTRSYDDVNARFDRLESALIQILEASSASVPKKDFQKLEKELEEVTRILADISGSRKSSNDNQGLPSDWKTLFNNWIGQAKNEFGQIIDKYPSLLESISGIKDEVEKLKKVSESHSDQLSHLSEEIKSLNMLEQKLAINLMKELDKVIPSRVVGQVTIDGVELHPQFLSYLKGQFLEKKSGSVVNDKEVKKLISSELEKATVTKKEILKHFEKEFSKLMILINDQKLEGVKLQALKQEIDALKNAKEEGNNINFNDTKVTGAVQNIVDHIVDEALERYSADRIALPDYALSSAGSRVVQSMTSSTYRSPKGFLASLLNIGVQGKAPIVALHPDVSLGNCWSFHGSQGNLTIALAKSIIPSDFSIEHIPSALSLDMSSAPKLVEVYGMTNLNDAVWKKSHSSYFLGSFEYDKHGNSIQTFPAQLPSPMEPVKLVQLRILSNHGNPDFTCLYRFRVHAKN